MKLPLITRECGTCDKCCTALGVVELGKPYYVKCEHQSSGCKIYGNHPHSCKEYNCIWRETDVLPHSDKYRPDNLGVIFDVELDGDPLKEWLTIYETEKDGILKLRSVCINTKIDLVNLILRERKSIAGVRFISYNTRNTTSYYINKEKYPDEGEVGLSRIFRPLSRGVYMLDAPQRGSRKPLPPETEPVSLIFPNGFEPWTK